ncbi:ABC transporter six-transmembrane domain-containing protein [Alkalispirochaeta alkalica]|uniref:ABC transporter six-transmembrane domain-containing protein n=1 Tax=Alkalispirochaeta alkalica TaxID=46356 RepID=UPI00037B19A8|nr:ABC transporter six-transmembrane domain-containing protein [Alkalispirochaeta alkalica]
MPRSIGTIFRPYRIGLAGTYTLAVSESVLGLMYPFTIGLAINGLMGGQGIRSVIPLVMVWLGQTLVGAIYQLVSSRVVARIYRTLADTLVLGKSEVTPSISEVAARVDMVEKVCDALTEVVPLLLNGAVGIVVSAVMLFLYDSHAGAVALALIVVIGLIQWWFGIRALHLNERINTRRESQVQVIEKRKPARVTAHFRAITRLNIRFKDIEAGTWAIADICSLIALLAVLFLIAGIGAYDVGSIYAMVTYIMTLTDSMESAPILVDEGAHFYDVSARVARTIV